MRSPARVDHVSFLLPFGSRLPSEDPPPPGPGPREAEKSHFSQQLHAPERDGVEWASSSQLAGFLRLLQYALGLQIFHSHSVMGRIWVQPTPQRCRVGIYPCPRVDVGVVLPDGLQQLQGVLLDTLLHDPPTLRTPSATRGSVCPPE